MGFERKKINLVSVWDTLKQQAKADGESAESAGVWAEFDFQTILEKTEKLHFYAGLISDALPPNPELKEKIRLLWGGRNLNTLILLVQEPLVANQLRYLLSEIEARMRPKTKYVPQIKIEVNQQQWGHFGIHLLDKATAKNEKMSDEQASEIIEAFLRKE